MTELPWIKSYPAGVRWNAELPTMPLQEILEESAKKWADKPALEFMGRRISYRELNDLANRAAKGLQSLGVKPGRPCRALSAEYAPLCHRVLRHHEGGRHGGE